MNDFDFVKQSAQKAGKILQLTEWFDDLKFIQVYKYLHSLNGGDEINMKHWMNTPNKYLNNQIPQQLITTEEGIKDVLEELGYYYFL